MCVYVCMLCVLCLCNMIGRVAELVWLQKGSLCSGTDTLAIFHVLDRALGMYLVYLHDDSKISFSGNKSRATSHVYLKQLRSIAKGRTWYETLGFLPAKCVDWPSEAGDQLKFNQDPEKYKKAVHRVVFCHICHHLMSCFVCHFVCLHTCVYVCDV